MHWGVYSTAETVLDQAAPNHTDAIYGGTSLADLVLAYNKDKNDKDDDSIPFDEEPTTPLFPKSPFTNIDWNPVILTEKRLWSATSTFRLRFQSSSGAKGKLMYPTFNSWPTRLGAKTRIWIGWRRYGKRYLVGGRRTRPAEAFLIFHANSKRTLERLKRDGSVSVYTKRVRRSR
jgi:hypothetical protein